MKNIVMLIYCVLPVFVAAQNKEISFQTLENWQQVLAKAKAENKTIFIDAYATWCGPCKKMEADVYTNLKIANYVNQSFIPIKVQFDQTDSDRQEIKNWYDDAISLQKKFQIDAFPTFLFISPAGKLIYKGVGYQDTTNFMALVKNANDPHQSYQGKIALYESGQLTGRGLLMLALLAKKYQDDSLAIQIAKKYKSTVIDRSPPSNVLEPEMIGYFASFGNLLAADAPIAKFVYKEPKLADSMLNKKGFSKQVTEYFIARDILNPSLLKDGKITPDTPNWGALERRVAKLYDPKTAKALIISYKVVWHMSKKDWDNYVKFAIEKQDFDGIDTAGMGKAFLNNFVYNVILKYSNNPVYLNKGLDYMKIALDNRRDDEASLDTYANVLYKLGRKNEALSIEARALALAKQKKDDENVKFYQETIQKMENNLPIPIQ
jgi:thioredoxin-related protein